MQAFTNFQSAIQRLRREHKNWNGTTPPDGTWWTAVQSVVDSLVGQEMTDDRIHLAVPIAEVIDGCAKTAEQEDESIPHRSLPIAVESLLAATPILWPRLETIEELKLQKIDRKQIAAMHGLPAFQAEAIIDGKAPYPKNHVTPHERNQQLRRRQWRDRFKIAMSRWIAMRQIDSPSSEDTFETTQEMIERSASVDEIRAAKTLEDMLDEGIDARSASEILGVEPESIVEEAGRQGFTPTDFDKLEADEKIRTLHRAGTERDTIAAVTGASRQQIGAVIRCMDVGEREKVAGLRNGTGKKVRSGKGPGRPKKAVESIAGFTPAEPVGQDDAATDLAELAELDATNEGMEAELASL